MVYVPASATLNNISLVESPSIMLTEDGVTLQL